MNIRGLSFLMAFTCAIPIGATEKPNVVESAQEETTTRDYKKEYAANTKLALASSGMTIGAAWGVAVGIATQSALIGCALGGPLFVVPAAAYYYLCNKYKNMFDEKAYKRVCDTEDKTFFYTMSIMAAPIGVILYGGLAYIAVCGSGAFGYGGGAILGTVLGNIATAVGITKDTATIATIGLIPVLPTILETKDELEKQKLHDTILGTHHTLSTPEKIGHFAFKYCKNLAYASALLGAASFAYEYTK